MDNTVINTATDVTNNTAVNDHTFAKGVGTGIAVTTLVMGIVKGVTAIREMVKLKKEIDEQKMTEAIEAGVPTEVPEEK